MEITVKKLYQWDLDRKVEIELEENEAIDEINFFNPKGDTAYVVEPRIENGLVLVDIPNILLQEAVAIHMYTVKCDQTTAECVLRVRPRQKPSDYVYTETEVLSYKALDERLKVIEKNGAAVSKEMIAEAVEAYMEENPVQQVDVQPDWNQNNEAAPDYIKNRIGGYSQETVEAYKENEEFDFTASKTTSLDVTGQDIFNVGDKMIITFDGVEYVSVGEHFTYGMAEMIHFGNKYVNFGTTNSEDTGEPFCFYKIVSNPNTVVFKVQDDKVHTVSISKVVGTEVVKIPSEFLDTDEIDDKISNLSKEIANLETGSGLSNEQRKSLMAVINAIGVFNTENGQKLIDDFNSAWEIVINATNITLDKTTLSFVVGVSQTLTATLTPEDSTDVIVWTSSNNDVARVTNGVVTPVSNGSCTITATAGSVSASCNVTVDVEEVIITYTITNNLTNVSTDNPLNSITENSGYTATLTPSTDYEFESVIVTMGGVDVTSDVYADGTIVISAVTGDVVITAIASEPQSEEVVLLKSITGDGASYIDTEFTADSFDYKYLVGMKNNPVYDKDASCWIFGSRCNPFGGYITNDVLVSSALINEESYKYHIGVGVGRTNDTNTTLRTGQATYDDSKENVSRTTEVPLYVYIENGLQELYVDEEMTTQPSNGTFMTLSANTTFNESYEMNIIPMYLCAINDNYKKLAPSKASIYCLKIWDGNDNLVVDMKPAKQGGKIGMYNTVTGKFHENKGTGTFTYEELEVA